MTSELATKKALGQYMTPSTLAEQMCSTVECAIENWRLLDPACGDGNLLEAAALQMMRHGVCDIADRLTGFDIDPKMVAASRTRLSHVLGCDEASLNIHCVDFLEAARSSNGLFSNLVSGLSFNVVLSNPPYGGQREYRFFEEVERISAPGTELVFLLPLSFVDRAVGLKIIPLRGRPMDVTTGHAIIHHQSGNSFRFRRVMENQTNTSAFDVLSGIKLYEINAGIPPQTKEIVAMKPYSSDHYHPGWLPCIRTGDVRPFAITRGRLWVDYGDHIARPKTLARFIGPKLFVRRVPMWATKQLGAAFCDDLVLCAGDVLVVRHKTNDVDLLKGLAVFLNSSDAATRLVERRPSLKHRMSFPKISAKDLNALIDSSLPSDAELLKLATTYPEELS